MLWEITRHLLVWYFATLSQVNVVYGSLTTAIVVLLSLEIAATLLLLGAQVISEYERIGRADPNAPPKAFHTQSVPIAPVQPSARAAPVAAAPRRTAAAAVPQTPRARTRRPARPAKRSL